MVRFNLPPSTNPLRTLQPKCYLVLPKLHYHRKEIMLEYSSLSEVALNYYDSD
jgi:hypothetical protein